MVRLKKCIKNIVAKKRVHKLHNKICFEDIIKCLFQNVINGVKKKIAVVIYIGCVIIFLTILIVLIYYQRMSEVDVAIKYIGLLVLPLAIFSGNKRKLSVDNQAEYGWARREEIIANPNIQKIEISDREYNAAGLPLIVDNHDIYVDNGESNSLIMGERESGKTRRLILPLLNILARAGQSVITVDIRGEQYWETSKLFSNCGYQVIVIDLNNPKRGNAWNPLWVPYQFYIGGNRSKAIELLRELAEDIFLYESDIQDVLFWERSALKYFIGLVLVLFEDENINISEINLNSVISLGAVGNDSCNKKVMYIEELYRLKKMYGFFIYIYFRNHKCPRENSTKDFFSI